jgi:hypothetical protein
VQKLWTLDFGLLTTITEGICASCVNISTWFIRCSLKASSCQVGVTFVNINLTGKIKLILRNTGE